jgi:hypothetical protein
MLTVFTDPVADTPSTEIAKFICTDPVALAAETPLTESMELALTEGDPTEPVEDTPVGVTVTGIVTEADPTAPVAETPVTLTVIGKTTDADPMAPAADTPVTSTGTGLFHAPEFQVLLSQPVIRAIMQS